MWQDGDPALEFSEHSWGDVVQMTADLADFISWPKVHLAKTQQLPSYNSHSF